jgi:phage terminase Nu1 subunit (DNA packaging protein)
MADTQKLIVNQKQAAYMLNTSARTLREWDKLPDPPPRVQGKRGTANEYDAGELVAWYLDFKISTMIGDVEGTPLNLEQQRARLASAQADRQELAFRREKGELIPAALVTATWQRIAAFVRARMLAIPSRCAPQMIGINSAHKADQILKEEIYDALTELSNTGMPPEVLEYFEQLEALADSEQ